MSVQQCAGRPQLSTRQLIQLTDRRRVVTWVSLTLAAALRSTDTSLLRSLLAARCRDVR